MSVRERESRERETVTESRERERESGVRCTKFPCERQIAEIVFFLNYCYVNLIVFRAFHRYGYYVQGRNLMS